MKLCDKFSEWLSGKGIFHFLNQLDVPWKNDLVGDLDLDYIGNRSGNKTISPLLEKINPEEPISDENAEKIAKVIFDKYKLNWQRLYSALLADYNPVYNNYLKEDETIIESQRTDTFNKGEQTNTNKLGAIDVSIVNGNQTITGSNTQGEQQNDTLNFQGQQTSTTDYGKVDTEGEHEVSAFNSTTYQDKNKNTGSTSQHTDTQNVSNREDEIQETIGARTDSSSQTVGERTDTQHTNEVQNEYKDGSRVDSNVKGEQTTTRDLERNANVGIRSSQELLMQEYDLRTMYNFWKVVYSNIDEVLVLKIY